MEHPTTEIPTVIHQLTQSPPSIQQQTLEKYFTPDASFTHPFCRTGSFNGSRYLILAIYRWYKILSPNIKLDVNGVAFDEKSLTLFVSISQTFRIIYIPFYSAPVSLTTVLTLTTTPPPSPPAHENTITLDSAGVPHAHELLGGKKYWIKSQNDLYQTSELVKFAVPFGIGYTLVLLWHFFATFACVVGAIVGWPITMLLEATYKEKVKSG